MAILDAATAEQFGRYSVGNHSQFFEALVIHLISELIP